jgi:hypothetical protein
VQCLVELPAIFRKLKCAAHLVPARTLFLGDEALASNFAAIS